MFREMKTLHQKLDALVDLAAGTRGDFASFITVQNRAGTIVILAPVDLTVHRTEIQMTLILKALIFTSFVKDSATIGRFQFLRTCSRIALIPCYPSKYQAAGV